MEKCYKEEPAISETMVIADARFTTASIKCGGNVSVSNYDLK